MLYLYVRKLGGVALYEVYAVQQAISEPTLRADHLHLCMCVTHSSGSGQFLYMIALFLKSVESVCRSIGIDVCAYCIWVMQFYIIVLYMWSATCLFRSSVPLPSLSFCPVLRFIPPPLPRVPHFPSVLVAMPSCPMRTQTHLMHSSNTTLFTPTWISSWTSWNFLWAHAEWYTQE